MQDQLLRRINPSAPHHGYFTQAINQAFHIGANFDGTVKGIKADQRLSDQGRREAIKPRA